MSYSCSDFYSDVMDAARRIAGEAAIPFPESDAEDGLPQDADAVIAVLERLAMPRLPDTDALLADFDAILAHAAGDDGIDNSIAEAEMNVRAAILDRERLIAKVAP